MDGESPGWKAAFPADGGRYLASGERLLFEGEDFAQTDVARAR
jgi:hypothetical protein